MIANAIEYERAQEELQYLEAWLLRLQVESPLPKKGLTRAGVRKMIARIYDEIAVFEGNQPYPTGKQ
ncbi:MAG: hypothetical protein IAF94_15250 [Pirellulaceae bacterium]|nr:hypothetical protein [Pirellulaceae bacterium]